MEDDYNAQTQGNPEGGESYDSVGQDGENTQGEGSGGWKEQAKYFQSEKDKLYSENQKLTKLAKIGEFISERPDVAQKLAGFIKGGDEETQKEEPTLDRTEFDSWEAYNDPSSKSYQNRQGKSQREIEEIVNERVGQAMSGIKQENSLKSLAGALKEKGLNQEQVKSFFEFASKGPASYGVDGAIRMWQAAENKDMVNPLDAVRDTQNTPQTGGIIQGHMPAKKDATDELWKSVLGASGPMGANGKLP
jgi:hypothetical protein